MIPQANAAFIQSVFEARLGDGYVYGGAWSPTDPTQGCDCSGCVGTVLEALTKGPDGMSWGHVVSTESWPFDYTTNTPAAPGTVGPYGTTAIASAADAPPDAALIVNIMHGGGGEDSHMNCYLQGQYLESNGNHGTCTGAQANPNDSPIWTDHWYLSGPIEGGPVTIPVVPLGLDYAGGRPGGAAIKNAGYDFVVRYLSDGGTGLPGKLLTPAEADDLRANGVDIVSNWETTADRALAGHDAGVADAQAALAQVLACGGRVDRPIYFSVDFDATEAQQAVIDDYLHGAGTVIPTWVGVYGGYWVVSRALDSGAASWGWQTGAWSGSNVEARRNLFQRIGTVNVGGVDCDVNEAHTPDFGQWSYQPPEPPSGVLTMADANTIVNLFAGLDGNGKPLIGSDGADYRRVDFLADYQGPAASNDPAAAGTYGTNGDTPEAPNTDRSLLDGFTTVAKIATRRYPNKHGQRLDLFDLLVGLYQAAGEPVVVKGPIA